MSGSVASPKVELRDVNLRYFSREGETEALKDISISVAPGEFVAIIGQSGCGKSTLLSLISGILRPTDGTVLVDGKPVTGPSRTVGYMLQQDYLFEWRTILDNALLGAEIQGADMAKARERATAFLTRYGLGQFLHHLPRQLSGGMRQRVALARTLCTEPDIVLLDEPFSALDSQTRLALADEITMILRREGKTAILVTHDIGEAVSMAERVIVLSRRPGRVKSDHPIHFATPDGSRPPRSRRATRRSSTATSTPFGRSSKSMSKADPATLPSPSAQYRAWLQRERRAHLTVRLTQVAILVVFLVLWEVLPKALIVNPVLTSYPSALWPTFLELLKSTPQQPGILEHTWATVLATVIGFTGAMIIGTAVAAALWWWGALYKILDPYLVVANAMPKTAFVPIFYIWLGASMSIYGMSLAISVFITILMIYSGFQGIDPNKIKLAQTFGATKGQILTKVVLPGSVPTLVAALKVNAGLSLVGVVVGEFQSANTGLGYLIQYGSQIFKMNIVMTGITILAIVSSLMYLAISWLEAAIMRRR